MASEEFGRYVPGKGYVAGKKKEVLSESEVQKASVRTPLTPKEGTGSAIQEVLTKVFGTVPRNKLKEAGLG